MTDFTPDKPDGAEFETCERCAGSGTVVNELGEEMDCPDCDGMGEFFQ